MDGRRKAFPKFFGAPPFERAVSSNASDDAKAPQQTSNAACARGLPAAVVEGRRAAEAARRRGAGRAVRRVALGRVYNGAVGPAAVPVRAATSLDVRCGPREITGPWEAPGGALSNKALKLAFCLCWLNLNSLSGSSAP